MHRSNWLAVLVGLFAAASVSPAGAGFVPGGGNATADCYAGLDVTGVDGATKRIECTEGDPCDVGKCGDGKCTFSVSVCVNQPGVPGCTPPAGGLDSVKPAAPFKSAAPKSLTGASCGTATTFDLKLKAKGKKSNKRAVRMQATAAAGTSPKKDQDQFLFVCLPRTTPCPSSPSAAFLD